jgi:hypothetical protein
MKLEDELHKKFKVKASMEGRKMNEVIVTLITQYVSEPQGEVQ